MAEGELTKIEAKTAAEVCERYKRSDEAAAVPCDGDAPRAFFDALVAGDLLTDAEAFLANALPKREAVWWACLCAREISGASPLPLVAAALDAAEAWVVDPSDANRRRAMTESEALGLSHPAGAAAFGAFVSGGSLAPPELPAVPPGDHHTAQAVAGSIKIAAVLEQPEKALEKHRHFLDLGIQVAQGRLGWDKKP